MSENFCDCGRAAEGRCVECRTPLCRQHQRSDSSGRIHCASCEAAAKKNDRDALTAHIVATPGLAGVVAALRDVARRGDFFPSGNFEEYRARGVAFETSSLSSEVQRLYREHPIDTGEGIDCWLAVLTAMPIIGGASNKVHHLGRIPAVRVAGPTTADGYSLKPSALVMADGTLVQDKPMSDHSRAAMWGVWTGAASTGSVRQGSGLSVWQARARIAKERKEVEMRVTAQPQMRVSEEDRSHYASNLLEVWLGHSPAARGLRPNG